MSSARRFAWCASSASLSAAAVVAIAAVAAVAAVASGCSPSSATAVPDPGDAGDDAAVPADDGGVAFDAMGDTGADAPSGACDGACKVTSLVADFGGKKRTLVRAQFGTQQGAAGPELHTESHLGGAAACPTQQSPSPDYTLLVTPVPRGAVGRKLSDGDGVTSTFFDFKGDLGLAAPSGITKAVSVNITVVAEDPATPPAWVALDVSVMFREGEVVGHLYAEYCQSLSQ